MSRKGGAPTTVGPEHQTRADSSQVSAQWSRALRHPVFRRRLVRLRADVRPSQLRCLSAIDQRSATGCSRQQ